MVKNIKDVINSLPKNSPKAGSDDFLNDDAYVESCEDIINDALKHGYDVLHMENGDIITTGTKVIVTQYRWDASKKKMTKVMTKQKTE
jgi:hypothetical protein